MIKESPSLRARGSSILNLGRGKLINTDDLNYALEKGLIKGAGLDVVEIKKTHPLLKSNKVVFTPHIGSYTEEAFKKNLPEIIIENVEAFIAGSPKNIVS